MPEAHLSQCLHDHLKYETIEDKSMPTKKLFPLSCFVSKCEQSSEGPSKCKNWWKVEDELFPRQWDRVNGAGSPHLTLVSC